MSKGEKIDKSPFQLPFVRDVHPLWTDLVAMLGAASVLGTLIFGVCIVLSVRFLSFGNIRAKQHPVRPHSNQSTGHKQREKPYRLRMGLRKVTKPWLLVDENYLKEHSIRKQLFERKNEKILGSTPVALAACKEVLRTVTNELTSLYPEQFKFVQATGGGSGIEIIETGECFDLNDQATGTQQLRTAATLASEDFNIIMRDETTGMHRVEASASCFPVGWSVDERLGWPVASVHGAVPRWQKQLQTSVERFLASLSQRMMERTGEFVQIADLDHDDLGEVLCNTGVIGQARPKLPSNVIIRTERQTFRRLHQTQAIVFAVKTWMRTLPELADHELAKFQEEMHAWPDDVALYKGRELWGETVDAYCTWRLG